MQTINVNELKPHPRNTEFFDDMSGEKWKEFVDSVKSRGIIEPIVITQNKIIVSGHQRVRACKELGIPSVMCDVHTYDNEDEILQDLLETNIRQRGDVGGSAKKVGLRIKELERLYGIKVGKPNYEINSQLKTQIDLASDMNMDVRTMQNYKKLTEMIPELEELVDTGITTPTTALAIMRNLTEQEQLDLISSMDTTKKITQKEVQKYIDEKTELEKKVKELESRKPETVEVIKEQVIDNTDYSLEEKNKELEKYISDYKTDYKTLKYQYQSKVDELQDIRKQMEKIKELSPIEQYNQKLQNSTLLFCSKIATFIEQVGGYVWLTDEINKIPDEEREGYIKAVHAIKSWADTMEYNINNKIKEIK